MSDHTLPTSNYPKKMQASPPQNAVSVAITNVAADKDFASVTFPSNFIPADAQVISAFLWLIPREISDTSGAGNAINAANKKVRVKPSTGAWGTDDIAAITFENGGLSVAASSKGSAKPIIGTLDISSIMSTPALVNGKTINVRSEQTTRSDAVTATGNALNLIDTDSMIIVEYMP